MSDMGIFTANAHSDLYYLCHDWLTINLIWLGKKTPPGPAIDRLIQRRQAPALRLRRTLKAEFKDPLQNEQTEQLCLTYAV